MNEHLVRPHPAPLTPAGAAELHADATNWRALLIALAECTNHHSPNPGPPGTG